MKKYKILFYLFLALTIIMGTISLSFLSLIFEMPSQDTIHDLTFGIELFAGMFGIIFKIGCLFISMISFIISIVFGLLSKHFYKKRVDEL